MSLAAIAWIFLTLMFILMASVSSCSGLPLIKKPQQLTRSVLFLILATSFVKSSRNGNSPALARKCIGE